MSSQGTNSEYSSIGFQEEKKRKLLKVRLEMAKFLQETIRETGMKSPDTIKESADFKEFFRKVSPFLRHAV